MLGGLGWFDGGVGTVQRDNVFGGIGLDIGPGKGQSKRHCLFQLQCGKLWGEFAREGFKAFLEVCGIALVNGDVLNCVGAAKGMGGEGLLRFAIGCEDVDVVLVL